MTHPGHSSDSDPRPWEQPGVARRDCAPHRGGVLRVLGGVATAWALLSVFSAMASAANPLGLSGDALTRFVVFCTAIPWSAALLLGGVTFFLAGKDLEWIEAGAIDPQGKGPTEQAYWLGYAALGASLLLLLAFSCMLPGGPR